MKLSDVQLKSFTENGFLLIDNLFTSIETDLMLSEMGKVLNEDSPRKILEKSGVVRSFFAPEFSSSLFKNVTQSKRLVAPSEQLLGTDVYVHQSKINTKHAMVGDWWEWHQDYTFWKMDDGMEEPNVLTAMIYLTDVNEFNGPMLLIPGSHKIGTTDEEENIDRDTKKDPEWFQKYEKSALYLSALTSNLKYTLKQSTIAYWANKNGIFSAKAPAGSVLFFHGNVFHASSNNLSPWDRHAFLITYNSVTNPLREIENPRPDFIAARQATRITALDYDTLIIQ